ncbi:MAG TPA: hypothetical protein VFJ90_15465 [Candidatus Didemnitutus sp.]|nr:hypothetical protein [Candidatus Didemnitutus sp.]
MYPTRELTRLAARKALLRQDIAHGRIRCAQAMARVTRPLAWLDRAVAFWRRLPPITRFAALPLGLLLQRQIARRLRGLGTMLRWAPLALATVRGLAGNGRRPPRD